MKLVALLFFCLISGLFGSASKQSDKTKGILDTDTGPADDAQDYQQSSFGEDDQHDEDDKSADETPILESSGNTAKQEIPKKYLLALLNDVTKDIDLKPGELIFDDVKFCLTELSEANYSAGECLEIDNLLVKFVYKGSLDLIRLLVTTGTEILSLPLDLSAIKENRMEVLILLVQCGLNLSDYCQQIACMFLAPNFHSSHFEMCLELGLPLHMQMLGINWIEMALIAGRLDIAYALYKMGFRISSMRIADHIWLVTYRKSPEDLVYYIALRSSFHRVKVILESQLNPQSILSCLPLDIILHHLSMDLVSDKDFKTARDDLMID